MRTVNLRSVLLAAPFIAGASLCIYFYFPGLMTPDPESQLLQARNFKFGDWHPIIMALIWRPLDMVAPGPIGMLLLFVAMYWSAFYLLARQLAERSVAQAVAISILPFMPFLINFVGTIWKDVLVFCCFVLAIALIGVKPTKRPVSIKLLAIILIWVGSLGRHNAALAAVPLLCLLLWSIPPTNFARLIGRLSVCMVLIAALVLGTNFILDKLLQPEHTHLSSALFLFDIAGISHRIGTNLIPTFWTPEQNAQILQVCYEPKWWDRIWISCMFVLDRLRETGEWSKLFTTWRSAVAAYPLEYLDHRLAHLSTHFRIDNPELLFVYPPSPTSVAYGFRPAVTKIAADLILGAASIPGMRAFFTVGFWLVLSTCVVFIAGISYFVRRAGNYHPFLIALSAFLYTGPLVLIGLSSDFRYVYYTIGATCIALVLLCSNIMGVSAVRIGANRATENGKMP